MRLIRDFYSAICVIFLAIFCSIAGTLLCTPSVLAWPQATPDAAPAELVFVVGLDKPPYIISQSDTGYELDLLRLIAKQMGYSARFIHVPNGRILSTFSDGVGDFATLVKQPVDGFYLTNTFVYYQNVVASLQQTPVESLLDFAGKRIIGFQRAQQVLGDSFNNATRAASFYQEVTNQKTQVEMLLLGRCDAVVMDRNIFYHYYHSSNQHHAGTYISYPFYKTEYHALARTEKLANQFDQALLTIQQQEVFTALQLRYFQEVNQIPMVAVEHTDSKQQ